MDNGRGNAINKGGATVARGYILKQVQTLLQLKQQTKKDLRQFGQFDLI